MDFESEVRERLVSLETSSEYLKSGVDNIKETLEAHVKDPCTVCKLQDDVTTLKLTQKWVRWASKTVAGSSIVAAVGYITNLLFVK